MINWLRRVFGPKKVSDPVFGDLSYMGGYWEGKGIFPATGSPIEWFVDAGEDGPGEPQRALFGRLVERYPKLLPAVLAALAEHIAAWRDESSSQDLSSSLRLVAVSIPESESPAMEWDLSFDSELRGSPHFAVSMKGWEPAGPVEVSR